MAVIHVTDRKGQPRTIPGKVGATLMENLRDNDLDIEAACGGVRQVERSRVGTTRGTDRSTTIRSSVGPVTLTRPENMPPIRRSSPACRAQRAIVAA